MEFYGHHNVFRISFKRLLKEEKSHHRSIVKNIERKEDRESFLHLAPTTTITTIDFNFSPSPTEEISKPETTTSLDPVITTNDDVFIEPQAEQPKPQRRKSVKSRNNSTTQSHEPPTPTTTKSSVSSNKKRE